MYCNFCIRKFVTVYMYYSIERYVYRYSVMNIYTRYCKYENIIMIIWVLIYESEYTCVYYYIIKINEKMHWTTKMLPLAAILYQKFKMSIDSF